MCWSRPSPSTRIGFGGASWTPRFFHEDRLLEFFHIPELIPEREEITFFYAPEVHFMERIAYEADFTGPTMHLEYHRRQRNAARRRVLAGIVTQEASC